MSAPLRDRLGTAESEAALIALLAEASIGPGWAKPKPSIYSQPKSGFIPAHWSGAEGRAALDNARRFVSTELAERRNLILVNPHDGNEYGTARTLVAAYQLVRAGEVARSHRHVPNALRLALDCAPGTYTVVEGERIPMADGDVLLTPNWQWHGHANEAASDAFWIDFLDVPLIHLLEPMFYEQHPDWLEKDAPVAHSHPMRFAYAEWAPRVRAAAETAPGDRRVMLAPPQMPTIGLSLRCLSAGGEADDARTTINRLYAVIEGAGRMTAGDKAFTYARGDVMVVPSWTAARWQADDETVMLCVDDAPVQTALGLLRTEGSAHA